MILDSLVILIMKNVNIARLYFLYGGLYWKILAKTIVWYLSVSKWRIFKMKLKNKLAGYLEYLGKNLMKKHSRHIGSI